MSDDRVMTDERRFPNSAAAVTEARRYTLRTLDDLPRAVADAVAVMVSELTTNSVRHAATAFSVAIDRTAESVRVSVTDAGPGQPTIRSPRPTQPTGRVLQIVRAPADDWGISRSADGRRKTVWFTVATAPR